MINKEEYDDILQQEEAIFKELNDIEEAMNLLKIEESKADEITQQEHKKVSYDDIYHKYKIEDMVDDFSQIAVPDIREDLKLLDELQSECKDDQEREIIRKEYEMRIIELYESVMDRKKGAQKMLDFFHKIKF